MTTHDQTHTKEYQIWLRMRKSCYCEYSVQYKSYGAKGYVICQEWRDNYLNFLRDMGHRPKNCKGIALINKRLKIFEPGNVQWISDARGRPFKNKKNL